MTAAWLPEVFGISHEPWGILMYFEHGWFKSDVSCECQKMREIDCSNGLPKDALAWDLAWHQFWSKFETQRLWGGTAAVRPGGTLCSWVYGKTQHKWYVDSCRFMLLDATISFRSNSAKRWGCSFIVEDNSLNISLMKGTSLKRQVIEWSPR